MAAKRNKILRPAIWFITILFILFVASGIVIMIFMPGFIIKNLSDYAEERSKGLYSLSIEGIEQELFPFSIKFVQVGLRPNEVRIKSLKKPEEKTFLTLETSEIKIEGIDLMSLYRNRKFACKVIRIIRPSIKLEGEELLQTDSLRINAALVSEIRPLFKYIREVDIGKIEFEEADLGFYAKAGDPDIISQAEKVSVDVLGLRTDAAMILKDDQFIETDDVLIRMNDLKTDMGDSLHVLTIDTLRYSLRTTDIKASGFNLYPISRFPGKNLFEVKVPDVYVKSRSITRFALKNSLKIRFLEFRKPEIRFFRKENPNRLNMEDINKFDLYSLVQNHFEKLEVDSFYLRSAHLEIFRQPEYENYQQEFESIDIFLSGFALDSTSAVNKEKLFHADDLEMEISGYHLKLEDDKHHFRADSVFVSTFSNRLGAKKVRIHPENINSPTNRTDVNIECEALVIEEVNLLNLYHTRTMPTSKIEVIEPDVHLLYNLEVEKRKKQAESGLLFEIITDYLRGVYANLVYIENGRLDIKNSHSGTLQGYFETNFNFSLTDFSLDSTSVDRTDKFFYATNFDLRFSDYHMQLVDDLHKLEVQNIGISSINRHIKIENMELQPVINDATRNDMQKLNRSELFNISVPGIDLRGVDLRDAFFNKRLCIEDFSISYPKIYFENFGSLRAGKEEKLELSELYQLIFNYMEDIDVKQFSIPDGTLTWVNHTRRGKTISFDNEFSASLENFRLNEPGLTKQRLFFSDNFEVKIKDQEFELSDNVHVLKGSEILLSSAGSSVNIKNALLFPLITSEKYHDLITTFQVSIPELKIEGLDFQKAYYSQEPEIDIIELVSPRFQIYTQSGKAKPLDLNAYRFPLPPFVRSLQLNELKITNAQAITYRTHGIDHRAQANFFFDYSMHGVLLKNNHQNQVRLTSNNLQLAVSDFKTPIDDIHNLAIGKIDYDRSERSISISDLKVEPFFPTGNHNRFSINAPKINFSEFDLTAALNDNSFIFKEVDVSDPIISIDINKEVENDTLEFLQTLDLYPHVRDIVNRIEVNNLWLSNIDLHFNWLQKQLFNNPINIMFEDILIGKDQPPSNLLNSKEFEISTTNLNTKSRDGLYVFSVDSLIYNSAGHDVFLIDLGITPLIDRNKFSQLKGFQTDVVNVSIAFAALQGIDERKWFRENIFDASVLKIGASDIDIYRNKRYPLDPDQRPPWPQDLLKQIGQPYVFDSIVLMPSRVRYSELMGISDEPGYVEFNNLTFTGGTLSNIEMTLKQHSRWVVNARASLFDNAILTARFDFDLTATNHEHKVKGSLAPMELEPLNTMLTRSAPMAIESGKLNRFEFDLFFDDNRSKGRLYMDYDNLKVAVLEYNSGILQKAKFPSFWANNMILNSRYPKGKYLTPVTISYPYDEQRSIINYWWKSLYSGAKEALGVD